MHRVHSGENVQEGLPLRTGEEIAAQEVRADERVGQVYLYTAGAFAASFVTAHLAAMSGFAKTVVTLIAGAGALTSVLGLAAVGVALVAATILIPKENSFLKHASLGVLTVFEGVILSPFVLLNSTAFTAAAATTVAVVGGLGFLATKIQAQFARFEKIMGIALCAIAAASLGAIFLGGMAGAIAHTVSMVGGFALFGVYVIYDTQKIREEVRLLPDRDFDVIHHTVSLYLDAVNLFVRIYEFIEGRRGRAQ